MKLPREFYIPKGSAKVADKLSDAVAYLSLNSKGKPRATVFFGKQSKPVADYQYSNEMSRAKHVEKTFEARRVSQARVAENRAERKSFVHAVQVGDFFRTCWGYDQTNVEFFEVVAIKGKFATLREVAQAQDDKGSGQLVCVPQSGAYLKPRYDGDDRGLPIRRLIQPGYNNQPHIKIDEVRSASPWGKRDGITGTVIGSAVYQTAPGWGH